MAAVFRCATHWFCPSVHYYGLAEEFLPTSDSPCKSSSSSLDKVTSSAIEQGPSLLIALGDSHHLNSASSSSPNVMLRRCARAVFGVAHDVKSARDDDLWLGLLSSSTGEDGVGDMGCGVALSPAGESFLGGLVVVFTFRSERGATLTPPFVLTETDLSD